MFAAILLLVLASPSAVMGGKAAPPSPMWEREFHSVMPLGSDSFVLGGSKASILLVATAISPEMEGWKKRAQDGSWFLYARDGSRAHTYPRQLQFRVTASQLERAMADYDPLDVESSLSVNDYLLGLRFQIKIFHGLHVQLVEPADIHMLGVPADIPYNERIYRLSFRLPPIPVQDRLVLEVLSPEGVRLARFHFELL